MRYRPGVVKVPDVEGGSTLAGRLDFNIQTVEV